MRVAAQVKLTAIERRRLETWSSARSTTVRLVERSKIVLMACAGMTNQAIAKALVLMQELRLRAARTACARSQVTWLRDRLLKLGVHVVRSVRRVVLHLPRSTPHLEAWRHIALALGARAG